MGKDNCNEHFHLYTRHLYYVYADITPGFPLELLALDFRQSATMIDEHGGRYFSKIESYISLKLEKALSVGVHAVILNLNH